MSSKISTVPPRKSPDGEDATAGSAQPLGAGSKRWEKRHAAISINVISGPGYQAMRGDVIGWAGLRYRVVDRRLTTDGTVTLDLILNDEVKP